VSRALLEEMASWSQQLAFLAARLSLVSPTEAALPVPVQHALAGACHWLLTASGALAVGLVAGHDSAVLAVERDNRGSDLPHQRPAPAGTRRLPGW
jgi:hypothetical protein